MNVISEKFISFSVKANSVTQSVRLIIFYFKGPKKSIEMSDYLVKNSKESILNKEIRRFSIPTFDFLTHNRHSAYNAVPIVFVRL